MAEPHTTGTVQDADEMSVILGIGGGMVTITIGGKRAWLHREAQEEFAHEFIAACWLAMAPEEHGDGR